jgi:hypothetical protein
MSGIWEGITRRTFQPTRYIPPYSRQLPQCLSPYDGQYLHSGKVRVELLDFPSSLIYSHIFSAAEETVAVPIVAIDLEEMEG